jgi:ribosomal protein L35AE/L33A
MRFYLIVLLLILATTFCAAQIVGTRVSMKASDGKMYTGDIRQVQGNQYRVRYDGVNFEAWLTADQFTLMNANNSTGDVGSKVTFIAADGKAYTGLVKEVRGNKYRIKYEGIEFETWLERNQFQIADAGHPTENTPAAITTASLTATHQVHRNGAWEVGDKVEVQDMYNNNKWEDATIYLVLQDWNPVRYRARLDNPAGHSITELLLVYSQIRVRGWQPTMKFNVSSRVDVNYADGTPRGRGTVLQIIDGNR